MSMREYIINRAHQMDIGQQFVISGAMFRDAFPIDHFNLHARTSADVCYNNLEGSNYGGFVISFGGMNDTVKISRNECGGRVRVDVDREHLYKKVGEYYYPLRKQAQEERKNE